MAFSQAVSGLNAAATNLDVIGNNIANSATYGFKSGSASFADMFAGSKVGLGVKVAGITQDFSDGTTTNTGRGLDVAMQVQIGRGGRIAHPREVNGVARRRSDRAAAGEGQCLGLRDFDGVLRRVDLAVHRDRRRVRRGAHRHHRP